MAISLLVFYVLTTLSSPVTPYQHDHIKALLNHIFTTNSYNKIVRPSADQLQPTRVFADLSLVGITDIDEVQEKMTTTAFLYISWKDDYITWKPSDYNGTYIIYVPQKDIWKPDIALENGFTKMKELGDDFILTSITFDGGILWRPYEVFETKCTIDIEYFPFDKQTCELVFGVWTSPLSDVIVGLGSKGVLLDFYQSNGEWDLLTTSASAELNDTRQDGAVAKFSITIKRKPQYILMNVVFPIVMLSLLSVFVFVLPVESGEKMGYLMTVYLAFAVFLTIVSASLPASSNKSLLSLYLISLLCFGTAIAMVTTVELRIHYRDNSHEIPKFVKGMIKVCKALRCRKLNKKIHDVGKNKVTQSNVKERTGNFQKSKIPKPTFVEPLVEINREKFTWPDVTSAVDFFCFWFFMLTNILITTFIFVNGYIKSNA